jgi:GTP:adenosylcobinamide-phosphate guanylyltransferase
MTDGSTTAWSAAGTGTQPGRSGDHRDDTHPSIGLIPAAGMARRLGITTPKELVEVDGRPVIEYSVDHMVAAGVGTIVVVIREGKEAIRHHLDARYPEIEFVYVYQSGHIGNLLDALKVACEAIAGHRVLFLMPDTIITPNPFPEHTPAEVTMLCFESRDESWRNFGVVSETHGRVIDKPDEFVGSVCWGALVWGPTFTERLMGHENLTHAINESQWEHVVSIDEYRDIGLGRAPQAEASEAVNG